MGRCKWMTLFAGLAALALVLGYILVLEINGSNARACTVEAKAVALAFIKYVDTHKGCLPPAFIEDKETGERHSWRVILLPHLAYDYMYGGYFFRESWNSPHNRELMKNRTRYACPAHSQSSEMTNYVAVVGTNTLWPEPRTPTAYEWATVGEHNTHWPSPKGRKVTPECVTRIAFVELVESDIPWKEPRDVTLNEFIDAVKKNPRGAFYNKYVNGILAFDLSGQIRVIDPYDDPDRIRSMFVVAEDGNGEAEENAATRVNSVAAPLDH